MKYIDASELVAVTGGMKWEQFGQSKNVEDRRTKKGIARDEQWWKKNHPPAASSSGGDE